MRLPSGRPLSLLIDPGHPREIGLPFPYHQDLWYFTRGRNQMRQSCAIWLALERRAIVRIRGERGPIFAEPA